LSILLNIFIYCALLYVIAILKLARRMGLLKRPEEGSFEAWIKIIAQKGDSI
jgi:hypothetical protein